MYEHVIFNIWDFGHYSDFIKSQITKDTKEVTILSAEEYELGGLVKDISLRDINLNVVFGCWPKNVNNQNYYWPTFWGLNTYYYTLNRLESLDFDKVDCLFVSLNNQPHYHRCLLMDNLAKFDLEKNNAISWNADKKETIEAYSFKHWKPRIKKLDDVNSFDHHVLPREFYRSLFSLVSESSADVHFLTEKSWVPLLLGKPVIIWGSQGINEQLFNLGLEPYNEIIDYEFDKQKKIGKRAKMLCQQLKNLEKENLQSLYQKIKPKIEHNRKVCLEIIKDSRHVPEHVLKCVDTLDKNPEMVPPKSRLRKYKRIITDGQANWWWPLI